MKKRTIVFWLAIACVFLLSACGCKHIWEEATCLNPRVCSICYATEGSARGHFWSNATCEAPKVCQRCGITEGVASGHQWQEATCTKPAICLVCSQTNGTALGHSWKEATCTTAATCYTCGSVSGEALGHREGAWEVTVVPSCTIEGTESAVCLTCNEVMERKLAKVEHIPGDWTIIEEPSENKQGKRVKQCTECGTELESESFTLSAEELESRYKAQCQKISYKDLARYPEKYKGEYVKFSGEIVQVCSEAKSEYYYSTYRLATYRGYDNVIYIYVDNYGSGRRILEDDKVTIYGKYKGLYTYTTVMGASVTIPSIEVEYIE